MEMTKDEAKDFFSEFYLGDHHIPRSGIKEFGDGWYVSHTGDLATFDSDGLTRLVLMDHEKAVRVSVQAGGPNRIQIIIFKRQRDGSRFQRHPSIEQVLEINAPQGKG